MELRSITGLSWVFLIVLFYPIGAMRLSYSSPTPLLLLSYSSPTPLLLWKSYFYTLETPTALQDLATSSIVDRYTNYVQSTDLGYFCPVRAPEYTLLMTQIPSEMLPSVRHPDPDGFEYAAMVKDTAYINYPLYIEMKNLVLDSGVLILRHRLVLDNDFIMDTDSVLIVAEGSIESKDVYFNGTIIINSVSDIQYDVGSDTYVLMAFSSSTGSERIIEGCGELVYGDGYLAVDRTTCDVDSSSVRAGGPKVMC